MAEDILIPVKADASDVIKQLNSVRKRIDQLNDKIDLSAKAMDRLNERRKALLQERDSLRLDSEGGYDPSKEFSNRFRLQEIDTELTAVNKELSTQEKSQQKIVDELTIQEEKYAELIKMSQAMGLDKQEETQVTEETTDAQKETTEATEETADAQKEVNEEAEQTPSLMDAVSNAVDKFANRMKRLMLRTFVFGVIMRALRNLKKYLVEVLKTDEQASKAMAQLKGSLISLAQPILWVLIPALTKLLQVLAKIVAFFVRVFALIFRTSVDKMNASAEAMYKNVGALESAKEAAEDYKRELADFDDLHILSSPDESDSGGGGGGAGVEMPDFRTALIGELTYLQKVALTTGMIALGLILLVMGHPILGVAMIALGVAGLVTAIADETGGGKLISKIKENFDSIMAAVGANLLVLGIILLFTPFVATGVGLIVLGLSAIAGALVDSGKGEEFIQWVKDVFAKVIEVAKGWWYDLKELVETIKQNWKDAWEWIKGIFVGLWNGMKEHFMNWWATISTAWNNIKTAFVTMWTAIKDFFVSVWNGLKTYFQNWKQTFMTSWNNIKTSVLTIVSTIKEKFTGAWESIKTGARNAWEGIKSVFSRVAEFFRNTFQNAWQKVKDVFSTGGQIFSGIKEGIVSVFTSTVNHIIDGINTVVSIPFNAINGALDGLRWIRILRYYPFSWLPLISVPQIPHLAQGSVVPPNKEFMAVLGDNKQETEVVSPLSTMKQALKEALQESGSNRPIVVQAMVDRKVLFELMVNENNSTVKRTGMSPLKV